MSLLTSNVMWRVRGFAVAGCLAFFGGTFVLYSAAPAQAAPTSAPSYYVTGYNTTWAFNEGCDAGSADAQTAGTQTRYVVLDFGAMNQTSSGWTFSAFGGADMPSYQARNMVQEFGHGYYTCTGSDTTSTIYVGLGTNNSGGDINSAAGAQLAGAAQNAWTNMSNSGWGGQARAVGANDFESWGLGSAHATNSRNWVSGYNGVSTKPVLVNYGSADGCPTTSVPTASQCNAGLPAESIWYVSWSGVAYPLPEIYASSGNNAKQWRYLSRYSYNNHGGSPFSFKGVLAQSGACSQTGGCPGADNGPGTAWTQLNDQLSQDSLIAQTPGAPTNIWWN